MCRIMWTPDNPKQPAALVSVANQMQRCSDVLQLIVIFANGVGIDWTLTSFGIMCVTSFGTGFTALLMLFKLAF